MSLHHILGLVFTAFSAVAALIIAYKSLPANTLHKPLAFPFKGFDISRKTLGFLMIANGFLFSTSFLLINDPDFPLVKYHFDFMFFAFGMLYFLADTLKRQKD